MTAKTLTENGVAARLKSRRAASLAKQLRRDQTPTEKILWSALRSNDFGGARFRRQAPIGPYVVDMVCHSAKLIIEIDGGVHSGIDRKVRDAERRQWLEGRGYRLFRFSTVRVKSDVNGVVRAILTQVAAVTPTPNPAPQGGGEHGEDMEP